MTYFEPSDLSGVGLVRAVAKMTVSVAENFWEGLSSAEVLAIGRAHIAAEWSFLPDSWSSRQVAEALRGVVPRWDDDEEPIYADGELIGMVRAGGECFWAADPWAGADAAEVAWAAKARAGCDDDDDEKVKAARAYVAARDEASAAWEAWSDDESSAVLRQAVAKAMVKRAAAHAVWAARTDAAKKFGDWDAAPAGSAAKAAAATAWAAALNAVDDAEAKKEP